MERSVDKPQTDKRSARPGDQAPEGTLGTGEAICPRCSGNGRLNGHPCPDCDGSGIIIMGIGGA